MKIIFANPHDPAIRNSLWDLAMRFGYGVTPDDEAEFKANVVSGDRVFIVAKEDSRFMGFWAILRKNDHVGEVHTVMSKQVRGATAIDAGKQALTGPFVMGYRRLISFCPADRPQSLLYAHKVGFRTDSETKDGVHVSLSRDEWLRFPEHKKELQAVGAKFHDRLFEHGEPHHEDDPTHDLAVGIALTMSKSNPEEAEYFYNQWAAQFGYYPLTYLGKAIDGGILVNIGSHTLHFDAALTTPTPVCQLQL